MGPLFIANNSFGPWAGDRWKGFITWSGLTQLKELVSLDALLCSRVLEEVKDEYWPYIVNEDFMLNYFTDLEFMLRQLPDTKRKNVLCVFKDPTTHPVPPSDILNFGFVGYDLIDDQTAVSALSNCGGFQKAFANDQLNELGLLDTNEEATKIQTFLLEHYPHEGHAICSRWAMFRAMES
ncbi:MAG: hypothetical protein AAF376_04610 [Pseudomonadota bacterium]